MDNKLKELCEYRLNNARDSLKVAEICMESKKYREAINRCYYAAFYAVKSVLALESVDFKRHKDVVAYFNQNYVATGLFSKELGKKK